MSNTTQLNKTEIQLSNGVKFIVVNDFPSMSGVVNSFDAAYQNWLARTDEYTGESFCRYVKSKEPDRICLLWEDYQRIANDQP